MRTSSPANRLAVTTAGLCLAALAVLALPMVAPAQDAVGQQSVGQESGGAGSTEFTAAEKAWLAAHRVIRVGAETNYAPYEFQDSRGHFAGVVADYMEILKRRLGVRFEVHQMPDFDTVESKLQKGEVDVVLALATTAEREEFLSSPSHTCTTSTLSSPGTTSASSPDCGTCRWSASAWSRGTPRNN